MLFLTTGLHITCCRQCPPCLQLKAEQMLRCITSQHPIKPADPGTAFRKTRGSGQHRALQTEFLVGKMQFKLLCGTSDAFHPPTSACFSRPNLLSFPPRHLLALSKSHFGESHGHTQCSHSLRPQRYFLGAPSSPFSPSFSAY